MAKYWHTSTIGVNYAIHNKTNTKQQNTPNCHTPFHVKSFSHVLKYHNDHFWWIHYSLIHRNLYLVVMLYLIIMLNFYRNCCYVKCSYLDIIYTLTICHKLHLLLFDLNSSSWTHISNKNNTLPTPCTHHFIVPLLKFHLHSTTSITNLHIHIYTCSRWHPKNTPFTKDIAIWTSSQDPNICNNVL